MVHGIAGARVDGMRILAPVADIILPVVAGGNDAGAGAVGGPDAVQFRPHLVRAVRRAVKGTVHAHVPRLAGRILPVAPDLADVHEHVLRADPVQIRRHEVAAISLCDSVIVQDDRSIGPVDADIGHRQGSVRTRYHRRFQKAHAAGGLDGRYGLVGGHFPRLEAEAPSVVQRARREVQHAAGPLKPRIGRAVHFQEQPVRPDGLPRIEPGEERSLVIPGKRRVDACKDGFHRIPDLLRTYGDSFEIDLDGISAALRIASDLDKTVAFRAGGEKQHGQQGQDGFFHNSGFYGKIVAQNYEKITIFAD